MTEPPLDAGESRPELSVIVTVTTGGAQLDRCLRALASQLEPPLVEILVPLDASLGGEERWRAEHPTVRFLTLSSDGPGTQNAGSDPGREHLVSDRWRAAVMTAARAPLIALTQDNARPAEDWCRRIAEAHRRWPHAAIGGAIENTGGRPLDWALYLSDFGRYRNPLSEGPARHLSDVNVSYKRAALERVASSWRDSYHETVVHGALVAAGEMLWLCPEIVVDQQREPVSLSQALGERFAWGRLYAGKRVSLMGAGRRLAMAVLAPLLPPLLLARHFRAAFGRGRSPLPFLRALPALAALESVWSLGELVGYWTGRPVSDR